MKILGLGGILKDAACAIVADGHLAAAVEENKVARHWTHGTLPHAAIEACLHAAKVSPAEVDCVAVARPLRTGPGLHMQLRAQFPNARLAVIEHQAAHAASAFYLSGFGEATVLTLDRSGDFRCGARYHGKGPRLQLETEYYFPDSLADLYSRVTELLGFHGGADEHKVQWLSAAGSDRFVPLFRDLLLTDSARLNPAYFDAGRVGHGGFGERFYEALGLEDGDPIPEKLRADVAHGVQRSIEEKVIELAGEGENLCLAGGLFYNALLVNAIEQSGRFKNVFVQPVAGNAGTAIGAALHAWYNVRRSDQAIAPWDLFLGPSYAAEEIKKVLENCKLRFRYLTSDELIAEAIEHLRNDQIIAWMQGRMEFGPRALGNRSILASPLNPYSTENLNVFIKHREPFRKFAASVPAELAGEYFEAGPNARFLTTVGRVKPAHRKTFEAAVVGEGMVRVHVVHKEENPLYHRLLLAAGKSNNLPVLYNTSFNLFSDPLVCTPRDAVRSFYSSGIDALFAGNFVVSK
ncbi:MAG: carbamoyltransferase [Acidobacteria bacterium]|nr:carbamoyltransferase [Acidobacteriota bacterium]